MAKRRANNEGTIFKRSDGKWRAQISSNGRRKSFLGDTQKECQDWIKNIRMSSAKASNSRFQSLSLFEYLEYWIDSIRSSRAENTIFTYKWVINKRILPFLGKHILADLNPERVQFFYQHLLKQGVSKNGVHVAHKVLNSALGHATKMNMINSNPCRGTAPPRPEQIEMKIFDEQQVKIFLVTAKDFEDQYLPLYQLALHTGMRQGELIGLKWSDINWENKTLTVQRQVIRRRGKEFKFTRPKSKQGNRTIALGKSIIRMLKAQSRVVDTKKELAGESWREYQLVFPTSVGTPVLDSNLRRGFRNTTKWAELPKIRFHDLRHTAASFMLNNGIPLLVVSKRLGHSKPSITLDVYGHLLPSKQQDAADLMDEILVF